MVATRRSKAMSNSMKNAQTAQTSVTEVWHTNTRAPGTGRQGNGSQNGSQNESQNEVQSRSPQNKSNAVSSNSRNPNVANLGNKSIAKQSGTSILEQPNEAILGVLAKKYGVDPRKLYDVFDKNNKQTLNVVKSSQKNHLQFLSKATKLFPRAKLLRTVVNVGWSLLSAPPLIAKGALKLAEPATSGVELIPFAGPAFSKLAKMSIMTYAYALQFWQLNGIVYYTFLFMQGKESVNLNLPYYGETQLNLRNISRTGLGVPNLNANRYGIPGVFPAYKAYLKFLVEFMKIFWNFIKIQTSTPEVENFIREAKETIQEHVGEIIREQVINPLTTGTLAIAEEVTDSVETGLQKMSEQGPLQKMAVKGMYMIMGVAAGYERPTARSIGYTEPNVTNAKLMELAYNNRN